MVSALPYFVAVNEGYFKAASIEPEMIRLIGGPPAIAALMTNQIDSAAALVTLEAMSANSKKPGVLSISR